MKFTTHITDLVDKGRTKFINDFSKEIYEQTYQFNEKDINDTHLRVAKALAEVEEDKEYWTKHFVWLLEDFKFCPGGRILSNAGTGLKRTTLINCYVDGFEGEDQDSMESILATLRRQALILMSEGGYGFCSDVIRPRGAIIEGIGIETPGAVRMLDMWDTQSAVITEGSGRKSDRKKTKKKIRKGAQMVTLSCWHPDIEEFITAKQSAGKLTKFNMSVLITDEFMDAVNNNKPWSLEFPDYESNKKLYKKEWDGNLLKWKAQGYPTIVYKTYENANELWNIIMESTYNRNEPGVLFIDAINRLNNLRYTEYINATNPCGEQLLPIGGVCLLGSLNLTQFVDSENKDWDWDKLKKVIPLAVRFLDNVNDITFVPLPSQEDNLVNKRRVGLGVMGYGSALMMMRVKYGSNKALELTEKLMDFIANNAYQASSNIARQKGSFLLYDEEQYLNSNFLIMLSSTTRKMIKEQGIRNSHLLSIQPTGNTAVLCNNVSGGLEPLFLSEYIRTIIMPYTPDGLTKPTVTSWSNKQHKGDNWEWIKEGDENLLKTEFEGVTYKFDRSRGLLKEAIVKDYAVKHLEDNNQWNPDAKWASTTANLTIDDHVKTMTVMSRYIDSAMSKTVNIPNDYPYEDFKRLYEEFHKAGTIKGGTTYRAGSMTTVLSEVKKDEPKIPKTTAPKRPKMLKCDIWHCTAQGKKWVVIVGLFNDEPYEVFAFKSNKLHLPTKYKDGKLTKVKKGQYDLHLDEDFILEDIQSHFKRGEEEALTRLISTSLRHGADIQFIYDQLQKSEGTIVSFAKAIARTLKRYIPDGNILSETLCPNCGDPDGLIFQEGCLKCKSCGASKC